MINKLILNIKSTVLIYPYFYRIIEPIDTVICVLYIETPHCGVFSWEEIRIEHLFFL